MKINVPKEILEVYQKLKTANFEAFLVGGCVRDLLLRELGLSRVEGPKDWDITTNATPEEIQKIFSDSVYENTFGTVGIKTGSEDPKLKIVEITTFRLEGKYTDKRHPDEIKFAKTVEEDLARRDFTMNSLALSITEGMASKIVDPFDGQKDIKNKILRTVGNPEERFDEDALRLMRAVRFATELGFEIEAKTQKAIKKQAGLLQMIAKERIRDEFIKIIMTENAANGIKMLVDYGLIDFIIPELRQGIGVSQNKHHIYEIFDHNVRSLDYAVKQGYSLEIRLAALFHDIGKPKTKRGEGLDSTFYGHEIVGARMTAKILDRLHFPKDIAERVIHLVRCHLFYYNVGEVTEAGVRRFLSRVGPENVADLIKVREADRIGSGVPKAVPYKLRHLLFMIEKVKRDPISPKMLKVDGNDVVKLLKITSGPRVGWILSILLEEVLDDPKKNNKKDLESIILKLGKLNDKELEKLASSAKETKNEFESGVEEEMKKKFWVK